MQLGSKLMLWFGDGFFTKRSQVFALIDPKTIQFLDPQYLMYDCRLITVTGRHQLRSSDNFKCYGLGTRSCLGDRVFAAAVHKFATVYSFTSFSQWRTNRLPVPRHKSYCRPPLSTTEWFWPQWWNDWSDTKRLWRSKNFADLLFRNSDNGTVHAIGEGSKFLCWHVCVSVNVKTTPVMSLLSRLNEQKWWKVCVHSAFSLHYKTLNSECFKFFRFWNLCRCYFLTVFILTVFFCF